MKKIKYILILTLMLIPLKTKAISINDYGTQNFANDLTSKLNNYFNYNYLVYYSSSNSPGDTTNFNIIPLKNANDICLYNNSGYSYKYINTTNNTYDNGYAILTNVSVLNTSTNLGNIFKNVSSTTGTSGKQSSLNRIHSSVDLYDCDNLSNKLKSADFTYTPPTNEECEECQECEEGETMEITNFPISKEEFYILLLLISTLIFMLFFKWTFKVKGGRKNDK
jgi:hypothetical protein